MKTLFVVVGVILTVAHACDHLTHYVKDGQCCKMCGQGKRMLLNDDCKDPRCQDCADGEYQDAFTKETRCKRQPSCDPNLNFEEQLPMPSKTSLMPCQCKVDHHCSSRECDTCVKNLACGLGEGVRQEATRLTDTVCQPCAHGTFSNETSMLKTCQEWTRCEGNTDQEGTAVLDRTCSKQMNGLVATVIAIVVLSLVVVLVMVLWLIHSGKICTNMKEVLDEKLNALQTCFGKENKEPQGNQQTAVEQEYLQRQPLEIDDTNDLMEGKTDNGRFVAQPTSSKGVSQQETSPIKGPIDLISSEYIQSVP